MLHILEQLAGHVAFLLQQYVLFGHKQSNFGGTVER